MATMPPGTPPPNMPHQGPPPGFDPREQRRWYRDQARAQRAAWKAQHQHMRWQFRSMRRGSILGPLILICVGVVVLLVQTGRINGNTFFTVYGHWWPLLLVAAGIIVLAEWALDQFQMRDPVHPQYRRSMGGGVIVLLIFLVFIGILVDAGLAFHRRGEGLILHGFNFDQDSWEALFGDKHEFDQTLDLAVPANGLLKINNPRGDVSITGTSDDGHIHIAEHKTVYATSDSDAENHSQQMNPKVETDGPATRVSIHGVDGAHADLTITVPADAALSVNVDHGDVHISSIKGAVNATTNHGNVELAAITGPATVSINNGGASVSAHNLANGITFHGHVGDVSLADIVGPVALDGDVFGTTEMERVNGTVHFHTSRTDLQIVRLDGEFAIHGADLSVDRAQGPFTLDTNNNNLSLDRVNGDISITNKNGSVELTAAPGSGNQIGNITIENRNGSVTTTVPNHTGFILQATTTNGDIDHNLAFNSGGQEDHLSENRNQKTLNGIVGTTTDAPTVHIRNENGNLSIMKGDVQPLTPPPPPAKITMAPLAPAMPAAPIAPKAPKASMPKIPRVPTPPTPPAPPNP